jgi:hypothetical protein
VNGLTYWRDRLRPYARSGYRTGYLTDREVVLRADDGREVRLRRPRRWLGGSEIDRALEAAREDFDDEAAAAARALWQIEPSGGEG